MRVQELMSTNLKTVTAATTADAAWRLMRAERIHHLVVMEGRRMAGVLSDGDIGGVRGAAVRDGRSVADLMTRPVITVRATTTLRKAANLMRGRTIGCLIVADHERPIGIVTTSDVLELLGRGAVRPTPAGRRPALNFRAPHRKRNRAYGAW